MNTVYSTASPPDSQVSLSQASVFIYALVDPRSFEIRYIGKTVSPPRRLLSHIYNAKYQRFHNERWVYSLVTQDMKPVMEILEVVTTDEADEKECWWIAYAKQLGIQLTNSTSGGEGTRNFTPELRSRIGKTLRQKYIDNPELRKVVSERNRGKKHSAESRKKRSQAISGENHPQFGKSLPEVTRKRIVESTSGDKNHFYGKHHTEESKQKVSQNRRGIAPINRRPVKIGSEVFQSVKAAALAFGVTDATIIRRIQSTSERFKGFSYLEECIEEMER